MTTQEKNIKDVTADIKTENAGKISTATTPHYILENIKKYQQNTVRRTSFLLYEEAEPELFNALQEKGNVSGYLRGLIADYVQNPRDLSDYMGVRTYDKGENVRINFLVNKNKFPELVEVLDQQESISEFMKALIRMDIGVKI